MAKVTIANLNTLLDDVVTSNIAVQDAQYAVTNAAVQAGQAATSAQAAAATKTQVDNQLVLIEEFANAINDDVQENDDIKEVILGLEAAIAISESAIELTKDNIAVMLSEVITSKSDIDIKAELVNEWVADFHTKYIGASLEAPNASWDGMELATGMIYYDIAKNSLMIYINTNIWVPIIEAVNMLIATNNLADLPDKPLARTNLGVLSVAEVEANIQADIAAIKGKPLGLAELDANGLVPTAQLPSYVDDVIEVATKAALPVTGESGKIYVVIADESSNGDTSSYRWTGSVYAMVSNTLTAADVKALYESNLDTNAYTDAEQAKVGYITVTQAIDLDTIESDTSLNNTHRTSNGTDHTYINQDVTTTATPTFAGLVTTGLVDGRDVSVDGLKLDGIEAGATADQTATEIEALYEGLVDTNKYTDAEKLRLANTESSTELNARDTANRARANHTGTQAAATISDFDVSVTNSTQVTINTTNIASNTGLILGNTASILQLAKSNTYGAFGNPTMSVSVTNVPKILPFSVTTQSTNTDRFVINADNTITAKVTGTYTFTSTLNIEDTGANGTVVPLTFTITDGSTTWYSQVTNVEISNFDRSMIAVNSLVVLPAEATVPATAYITVSCPLANNGDYSIVGFSSILATEKTLAEIQNLASAVIVVPQGNLSSSTIQLAVEELQGDIDIINAVIEW